MKGALNEIIADIDPELPKHETMTGTEIPTEDTVLATKAESEDHLEFIEIELPTVAAEENDDKPKSLPYTVVVVEPVKGETTAEIELNTGPSVENADERRPTEAAEI
jgi:hypothetical protein